MGSGAWNIQSTLQKSPYRFLSSSVGRALEWWSAAHGFKPHWRKFLMKFILFCVTLDLSDNLTEIRQISLLGKTQMSFLVFHDMRFCQIIWQIFTQGGAKKNSSKIAPSRDWTHDLRIIMSMLYQLNYVNIQLPAWIFTAFIKSLL